MSESELSDAPSHAIPSDATLETELRRVVRDALKQDEDITVGRFTITFNRRFSVSVYVLVGLNARLCQYWLT